jgi:tRNA threonylcarbamoyl adenosine modification protein YjeE
MEYAFELPSLQHLHTFAAGIAAFLRGGDVVALSGPVGAGKTTLVRAVLHHLLADDGASSPSFTIWQQYPGPITVHHLDLYRIDDPHEFVELGLHEAFDPHSITIVEWPERAPHLIPFTALHIRLDGAGDETRMVHVRRE